jgi:hypothetical protein
METLYKQVCCVPLRHADIPKQATFMFIRLILPAILMYTFSCAALAQGNSVLYRQLKEATHHALQDNGILGSLTFFHDHFYFPPDDNDPGLGTLDLLGPCDTEDWVDATYPNPTMSYVAIAIAQDLVLETALDKLGFSGVAHHEFTALDRLGAEYLNSDEKSEQFDGKRRQILELMAAKLNKAIAQNRLHVPRFIVSGGCGGAGTTIHLIQYNIHSEPPQATIKVLSSFNYYSCLLAKIDPFDTSKCFGWTDVSNPMAGIGPYHYIVEWPDHVRTTGTINVASPDPLRVVEFAVRK